MHTSLFGPDLFRLGHFSLTQGKPSHQKHNPSLGGEALRADITNELSRSLPLCYQPKLDSKTKAQPQHPLDHRVIARDM
jgi:hypothetical protein